MALRTRISLTTLLALAVSAAGARAVATSDEAPRTSADAPHADAGAATAPGASPVVVGARAPEVGAGRSTGASAGAWAGTTAGASAVAPTSTSPMHAEMRQALDDERLRVAALEAKLRRTADPMASLEIQKQIETVKLQSQVAILRIQARHARASGKAEIADQLEAAIVRITGPPPAVAPAAGTAPERPHPSAH